MTLNTQEYPATLMPFPRDASVCSLSDILEGIGAHLLPYYLSARACAGIRNRAASRGKSLPPALALSLERMAKDPSEFLAVILRMGAEPVLEVKANQVLLVGYKSSDSPMRRMKPPVPLSPATAKGLLAMMGQQVLPEPLHATLDRVARAEAT